MYQPESHLVIIKAMEQCNALENVSEDAPPSRALDLKMKVI